MNKQLVYIIQMQLGVRESEVTEKASIVDDLGADSLDQVEIIMEIEEEFGIEISDEEAEKMITIGDLDNHLREMVLDYE